MENEGRTGGNTQSGRFPERSTTALERGVGRPGGLFSGGGLAEGPWCCLRKRTEEPGGERVFQGALGSLSPGSVMGPQGRGEELTLRQGPVSAFFLTANLCQISN